MYAKVNTAGLFELSAFSAIAEASLSEGVPDIDIIGLPDAGVREAKTRIKSAVKNSMLPFKSTAATVNISPASVKKTGSHFDIAILASLLSAQGCFKVDLSKSAFLGELSLSGDINPVAGILPMVISLKKIGVTEIYVPSSNAKEATLVPDVTVFPMNNIRELYFHLIGQTLISPSHRFIPSAEEFISDIDFCDVKGQVYAARALEVAAAGFHNILMVGIPGVGKSMLAKRLPTILPPMSFKESIETTEIYSFTGLINKDNPLIIERPFRFCSPTASLAGVVGGGAPLQPGELSLSHNGILFLDELPEFPRNIIESLRQPMEDGFVHLSRVSSKSTYPCRVMLVAAMNPCPCGFYDGGKTNKCTCTEKKRTKYVGKISGPIFERIDIHIELSNIKYEEMTGKVKSKHEIDKSAVIRERIIRTREIQKERYKNLGFEVNSEIPQKYMNEFCILSKDAEKLIEGAFSAIGLSPRGHNRLLKVARTVADLRQHEEIDKIDAGLAINLRALDRKIT